MRIAIITTSRADYGIYHSLLTALAEDPEINYGLVVSGSHLSRMHGYTVAEIETDGHPIWARIPAVPTADDAFGIARAMGAGLTGAAEVWQQLAPNLDLVICLGDRYEMFAAVAATVPFNLPVAHLHGGETTLGAMDDKFRHALTAMSTLHFTATKVYTTRVESIIGSSKNVFTVGAPSLDGLQEMDLPGVVALDREFGTNFQSATILVTLHPETVELRANEHNARVLCSVLTELTSRYQVVITLPNADTQGTLIREHFFGFAKQHPQVKLLESFGKTGYFAAMKHCAFLLGNSSSGLLEAASFGKFAINIGRRQEGRVRGRNVLDVAAEENEIRAAVRQIEVIGGRYEGANPYRLAEDAASRIIKHLKAWIRARTQEQEKVSEHRK